MATFDVIIIGGGPGGMSAALWCADLGLNAVLVDQHAEFGGQLLRTFNPITNYLGIPKIDARDLCSRFLETVASKQVMQIAGAMVTVANLARKTVELADGRRLSGRSVIIATGVRRRSLGVPGEVELVGKGILESGVRDAETVRGKSVVIVGGGDAAIENAILLAETAASVSVIHRRSELSARSEFVERLHAIGNVRLILGQTLSKICGQDAIRSVQLGDGSLLNTDAVLIRIGVEPNTELFRNQLALDDSGYVSISSSCETSREGVYAIGDAASPGSPTIMNAAGQASAAAKSLVNWLRVG